MARDLGFIAWKDPREWMEAMRGPRWAARIQKENRQFKAELADCATVEEYKAAAAKFQAYFTEEQAILAQYIPVGKEKICLTSEGGGQLSWRWEPQRSEKNLLVGDIDVVDDYIVYSQDTKAGGRHYEFTAMKGDKVIWKFDGRGRHGLSGDVAILGGRVYALEAASPLQYKWLVSVDLLTGKDRRVHYEEHDLSTSLELVTGENKCLFLYTENGGKEAIFHVGLHGKVEALSKECTSFYPVGYGRGRHEPCYFAKETIGAPWKAYGSALKALALEENLSESGIEFVNLRDGLVVHRRHGTRYVDSCRGRHKRLLRFIGEIGVSSWRIWNGHKTDYTLFIPGQLPVRAALKDGRFVVEPPKVYASVVKHGFAKSRDGTAVGWVMCWSGPSRPKALLVIGYGAYGLTTPVDTARWRPFIEAGFAVGFAFVRGGGDHNDAWAEAGRLDGKLLGVEDFEACIRGMQKVGGLGPKNTCIFGRSAGGYLVGTTIVRNPGGQLARFAYTEAPYVDVLQTASNVKLPLTVFEYLEFGDPAHKIYDFQTMLELSPVSALGPSGAPGVFVLCRVGLNDRQVYAYESVKWMDALRGKGGGGYKKLLYLTEGYGHNVHGADVFVERAEDLLLLVNGMCLQ